MKKEHTDSIVVLWLIFAYVFLFLKEFDRFGLYEAILLSIFGSTWLAFGSAYLVSKVLDLFVKGDLEN